MCVLICQPLEEGPQPNLTGAQSTPNPGRLLSDTPDPFLHPPIDTAHVQLSSSSAARKERQVRHSSQRNELFVAGKCFHAVFPSSSADWTRIPFRRSSRITTGT